MAGRSRKPAGLKAIQGTLRRDRINHNEPKPKPKIPTCPDHLTDGAKTEWGRICGELHDLGLLTGLDAAVLAGYCAVFDRWATAEINIREHGAMIVTPNGFEQSSSWVTIAQKSLEIMRRYMTELGLTPSSRPKISAKPLKDDEENPFSKI